MEGTEFTFDLYCTFGSVNANLMTLTESSVFFK